MSSPIAQAKSRYDRILWEIRSNKEMRRQVIKSMDRLIEDGYARLEKAERELNNQGTTYEDYE